MDVSLSGEGMVAGSVVAMTATLVERRGGTDAVDRWLTQSGPGLTRLEVADISRWTPIDQAVAMFEAASRVIDEPDLGRVVGAEMLRQYRGTELHALLRSLESPENLISHVSLTAYKFATTHSLRAEELADDHAVVVSTANDSCPQPMWCGFIAGLLSQASSLFGMDDASVIESTCQCNGDPQCTFEVRWDPATGPSTEAERRIAELEDQVATITARFEALQATATELVAAKDVAEVLREIINHAGYAVRATHYALAVRLTPNGAPSVEHRGYGPEGPGDDLIDALLADVSELPEAVSGSLLVVDVATRRRWFGRMVAMFPGGSSFLPEERRLLKAYAANAATALEATAAREEAQRRHQTARALLQLSSALGEVGTSDEVAQRLAEAVLHLIDSSHAGVLLWDDAEGGLRYRGYAGYAPEAIEALGRVTVTPPDTPLLPRMLQDRKPIFIEAVTADPFLSKLLATTGVEHVVVVPIGTQERFMGVVVTPVDDNRDEEEDLLERLRGLTSQGATALENANLVERLHHQGLHDPLSGLPNRRLFRNRTNEALERARRTGSLPAVVFIDLDDFKVLNDSLGHEAGDKVIAVVAERLNNSLRSTDTVARFGGDEFAVILEGLNDPQADATKVARKLVAAIRDPMTVMGLTVGISASAGVVVAKTTDDHDSLLRRADANMYKAKSDGRDRAVADAVGSNPS